MKRIFKSVLSLAVLFFAVTSCDDGALEVDNTNQPDLVRVYGNSDDLQSLAGGLFVQIYEGANAAAGPACMLATAADNVSCSWGNFGMRDMSWEPRNNSWNNTASYGNRGNTKHLFDKMYGVIVTGSNIMKANQAGIAIGDGSPEAEARAKAVIKFNQGVAYSNLALVFDKAFIVDENKTVENSVNSAVPYEEVAAAAISYLEEAIDYAGTTFTIPAAWFGTEADMSSADFIKLCNTYAARTLAYLPRNNDQLQAVDWAKVKAYADAGITADFNIMNDAYAKWYHESGDYLTYSGWGVTDMYVVHLMDPAAPQHWDDNASFPHPPEATDPADQRIFKDFDFLPSNWFQATRGYYHFSNHRYSRTDAFYVNAQGLKAEIMLAENDMLRAEARVYLNELAAAADIINDGTRTTRGEMDPVDAVKADLIQAIHHERHVEMYITSMGLQFFEMRKLDLLQEGTPLHLPLPAEVLQTLAVPLPFYSFGQVANADGVNTSNGGWR
jgi:starch-binding outer membrane protein, SusD/RagB family